jgi:hypothetical protein
MKGGGVFGSGVVLGSQRSPVTDCYSTNFLQGNGKNWIFVKFEPDSILSSWFMTEWI